MPTARLSHTAVAELRSNAGSQFDPRVVETLLQVVARDEAEAVSPAATTSQPHRQTGTVVSPQSL